MFLAKFFQVTIRFNKFLLSLEQIGCAGYLAGDLKTCDQNILIFAYVSEKHISLRNLVVSA